MKIRKFKVLAALLLCVQLIMLSTFSVFASGNASSDTIEIMGSIYKTEDVIDVCERYDVEVEELVNLEENLSVALEKASFSLDENQESINIQVSDNLFLEITSTKEESQAYSTDFHDTYSSTFKLLNNLNWEVLELRAYATFSRTSTNVTPIDAYGISSGWVWNITTSDPGLGPSGYSGYARVSFHGELNIGIEPVAITIQTFNISCKFTCYASGNCYPSWDSNVAGNVY